MTVKIFWLLIDLLEKPDLSSVQCKRLRVIYISGIKERRTKGNKECRTNERTKGRKNKREQNEEGQS